MSLVNIQGVSGGILNTVGGGSGDFFFPVVLRPNAGHGLLIGEAAAATTTTTGVQLDKNTGTNVYQNQQKQPKEVR